ncbi:carbon monoxide dehydrogenase [Halosimplex rubrum]|uniref:Carbon monoxide dehydrogenase n=1 Tax=Halosimplex rubrum TaxID=869889 RepID=A0A7D5P4D4_9EURY|nr:SRPBCC domain-containing protein [Halosimplex rubrum]QLH77265.1 carbon monoxide dehydrogenase [Halosimplex rubrum]
MSHPDDTRPEEPTGEESEERPPADADPERPADDDGVERLEFADAVYVDAAPGALWDHLSDPETLTRCVPGAESIERLSERRYSVEITRGVSRLTVSLSGEAEFVEMDPPDHVVTSATAFDSTTGSEFDVLAAMEIRDGDRYGSKLAYTAEVTYTGGAATLNPSVLRPIVERDIDSYFGTLTEVVEGDD